MDIGLAIVAAGALIGSAHVPDSRRGLYYGGFVGAMIANMLLGIMKVEGG